MKLTQKERYERGGPKCRSAMEGKGKGIRTVVGRKEEGGRGLLLVSATTYIPSFAGLIWPRWVCAAVQIVDL